MALRMHWSVITKSVHGSNVCGAVLAPIGVISDESEAM